MIQPKMLHRHAHILLLTAILVWTAAAGPVQAATYSGNCGANGNNVTWTLDTSTGVLAITGSGAMADYGIDAPWYGNRSYIKTVTIGNGVTTVGAYAFYSCSNLTSASLPASVTSIKHLAFDNCTKLATVNIPNRVTVIEYQAFNECQSLTSVNIPASVASIGNFAFGGCDGLTAVTLPEGVSELGGSVFKSCQKLKEITFPSTLANFGTQILCDCPALTDIYVNWTSTQGLPAWRNMTDKDPQNSIRLHYPCGAKSVYQSISGWADYTLTGITTGQTIRAQANNSYGSVQIDDEPAGASVTKTVYCDETVTITAIAGANCSYGFKQWSDGSKENPRSFLVSGNINLTAEFANPSTSQPCGANGNNLMWKLDLCTGVLTITGSGAMADWDSGDEVPWGGYAPRITSVVLPVGLTHIGAYAFYRTSITTIDVPAAVRTFGSYAFVRSKLQEICIPEGVTTLPPCLFGVSYPAANAAPLRRIYLPSTLTTIGENALSYTYYNMPALTFPASINQTNIVIIVRGKVPAREDVYVSWTENIPLRGGRIESIVSPRPKMHVPYGTTALYTKYSDAAWSRTCEIVEDVDERAIDLGLSIRWASCNVGASAPEENGGFFAWGDTLTRASYTWTTYPHSGTAVNTLTKYNTRTASGVIDNRSSLLAFDDAAYINWGETWRMPTWAEWTELMTQCTWEETTLGGVAVWQVTGPNGNSIFLPKAGYKADSSVTDGCCYWSSSLNTATTNDGCNRAMYIDAASRTGAQYGLRYAGMPVRAVYRREWPSFTVTLTDTPDGVAHPKAMNAGQNTITAQEDDCHRFVHWSDGNTDNPRTINLTANATYTAQYESVPVQVSVQAADAGMGDVNVIKQ